MNMILGKLLRGLSGENPSQWELVLAQFEFTYNDSINNSIGGNPILDHLWQVTQGSDRFSKISRS